MLGKLQDILLNNWSDYGIQEERLQALDFILLTNYNLSPSAKTIIFAVSKPEAKGVFLIKISKTMQAKPFLENAHQSLKFLYTNKKISILTDTFPHAVFARDFDGHFVQVETFAAGRDLLSITLRNKKHAHYLLKTKDWLIRFHHLLKEIKVLDDENIQRHFRDDIDNAKPGF